MDALVVSVPARGVRRRTAARALALAACGTLALGGGVVGTGAASAAVPGTTGDFNGDGWADLAVGVPSEDIAGLADAGAVNVIYGGANGLSATRNQFWHQNNPGVPDIMEAGDQFGSALAVGNFNGDAYADLAIGIPGEDVSGVEAAGAVNVIYGSANGLTGTGGQFWTQDSAGVVDTAEAGDQFGATLTAGDFNGDGRSDLAVGVYSETVGGVESAGAVQVLYGSANRLSATGNQLWTQDSPGIAGDAEWFESFGGALAAGDFNGDGRTDLAIGVAGRGPDRPGEVNVIYGSASGLTATGNQLWTPDTPGVPEDSGPSFGVAVAAGDFNGDGRADLAVGAPYGGPAFFSGSVTVLYGSASGLTTTSAQKWDQDVPGIADEANVAEYFGSELAAGDFNGDRRADLAIGVHESGAGGVNVLYGSAAGLAAANNQFWDQDSAGIQGTLEQGDGFGLALAALNVGKGSAVDLVIGVPGEDGSATDVGMVNVIYGSSARLTSTQNQIWLQNSGSIQDVGESGDAFGAALGGG